MWFLHLGFPIHPTEVLYLDEDSCADLVNRVGRNYERLLSIHVGQSSTTLERAKKGGHIRWHTLATEQEIISSDFRDNCQNTFYVLIGLEEPRSGVTPDVLDEADLRELVQAVGVDFDNIRKLGRDQVVWVHDWLREAGLILCFEVQQDQTPVNISLPESLKGHNTDLSQSSIDPSLLTIDRAFTSPVRLPFHNGSQFDLAWEQYMTWPQEQNTVDWVCPEPTATPVEAVMSPKPSPGALSCLTPPCFVNLPPAGQSHSPAGSYGGILQSQSIHTPLSIDSPCLISAATPAMSITTGIDANALSYPTPSTCHANSPLADDPVATLSSCDSTQTKLQLLQLCRFGEDSEQSLDKERISQILKAEAGLLAEESLRPLQPFLGSSQAHILPSLYALGLPVIWKGIEGAVNYYRVLEAEKKETPALDPLAKRIAQFLFYLNYRWLEKHVERGRTPVTRLILKACPAETITKPRRDNITGYHKRRGEYCWLLVACLGAGVLLYDTIDAM
ncbi:uncharacterized protein BDV14DRAFT_185812 [Aspergillus stella-maris]|uniref:uncharacterized protein n=1 Tax=Aspergillus stella-maris TaxID=1810926 RepID=UPI003CCE3B63